MEISQSVKGGSDPDYFSIMSPGFETWRKELRSHSHHNVSSDDRHGRWSGNDHVTKDRVHDRREAHEYYDRGHGLLRNNGIPCKYFAAGNCRNEENCWFSHHGPGSCNNLDLQVKSRRSSNWGDTSVTPYVAHDQRSCVNLNNRENSLAGPMWNSKAVGQNLRRIPHLSKNNGANMAIHESAPASIPPVVEDPAAVGINNPNQTSQFIRPCDPRVNFQQASRPVVTTSQPPGCSPSTVEKNRIAEQMLLKGSVPSSLKNDEVDHKNEERNNHLEDMDVNSRVEECEGSKDAKSIRMFKFALVDFVKDIIKPTWKGGRMSNEAHNTIVKKAVDKVIATIEEAHVPRTKEEIDHYLSFCKPKLLKLVQAYVERYLKSSTIARKP